MKTRSSLLLLLLATLLAVTGCSGIPLSTMWHFRNFGPQDILKTDPALIRAALQLENGVNIKGESAKLDIQFQFTGESRHSYSLPLTMLTEGRSLGVGIGTAEAGKHWYLFALSSEGVRKFHELQQILGGHMDASGHFKKHGKATLSVQAGDIDFSADAKQRLLKVGKMFMRIRLELSLKDGFYTLYEGKVPFSKSGKGS